MTQECLKSFCFNRPLSFIFGRPLSCDLYRPRPYFIFPSAFNHFRPLVLGRSLSRIFARSMSCILNRPLWWFFDHRFLLVIIRSLCTAPCHAFESSSFFVTWPIFEALGVINWFSGLIYRKTSICIYSWTYRSLLLWVICSFVSIVKVRCKS